MTVTDETGQWIEKERETRIVNGEPIEMHRTVEDAVGWFATFTEAYFEVMDMNAADYAAAEESMPEGITVLGILEVIRNGVEIMWIANGGTDDEESEYGYTFLDEEDEEVLASDMYFELNDFERDCDETWPYGRDLYFEGDDEQWPVFEHVMNAQGIDTHDGMFFPGENQVGLAYAICRNFNWPFGS